MLARWLEKLAPYKFQVVHVKGTSIGHADALSRRPNRPCNINCKKCVRIEEKEAAANGEEQAGVNIIERYA